MGISEIDAIYKIAIEEVGYLEKKSNAQLDSKTANAGYNNYTKYWRDSRKRERMRAYGYSAGSDFAGGPDWPYCAGGIDDTFCRALGAKRAGELLLHTDAAYINCQTMYEKAKAAGKLHTVPKVGDIVLFYNSHGIHYHTEWIYKIQGKIIFTVGWNTSGASSVIANGGGVCAKRYQSLGLNARYFRPAYQKGKITEKKDTGISVTRLKKGSKGSAVQDMQQKLIVLGFDCGVYGADGDFGEETLQALLDFQEKYGLEKDGIYGENTARKLNTLYASKKSGENKEKDPTTAKRLFIGRIKKDGTDVRVWAGREYGNIKSWPKLNKGNLVDVLDYDQYSSEKELWRFVRIAGTKDGEKYEYYGFVLDKYIKRALT